MAGPSRISALALEATGAAVDDYAVLDRGSFATTKKIRADNFVGSRVLAGKTLIVDSVNGSATLGVRGSLPLSFSTITLALAAASSGDTVVVYPGTYDEKNLLKNGVNLHFMPGANVTYTGSAAGGIFDDSVNGANGAVSCVITGQGAFTDTISGASGTGSIVNVTNAGSSVIIKCKSIVNLSAANAAVRHKAGYLSVDADILTGNYYAVWWDAGDSHIRASRITSATGSGVHVTATGTDSLWVTADQITAGVGVRAQSGNANSRIWVNVKEIIGGVGYGVLVNDCKVYVDALKISASQPFLVQFGTFWMRLQKMTMNAGASTAQVTGGSAFLDIQYAEDLGSTGTVLDLSATDGNIVSAKVGVLKTGASRTAGVKMNSAGTGRCIFDGLVDAGAATSGNPILLAGDGQIVGGSVLVANGSQDSITGNFNAKVYGQIVANTDKAAGTTIQVGTLTFDANVV